MPPAIQVEPHLGAAIGGTTSGLAGFIERRRLYWFATAIDTVDNVTAALLFKAIGNTNTKAANINIYFNRLIVADNFSNQTRHFHRIKAMSFSILVMQCPCRQAMAVLSAPFPAGSTPMISGP
jgi:hypothetical protein